MGAFQVRQFLLTSYASERALLVRRRGVLRRHVAARHLQRQDVRRAGDGDALAVPSHAAAARVGAALRHAASGAAACGADETERRDAGRRRLPPAHARAGALRRDARRRRARASKSRRGISASCAAAMRGRSSRCSSTTASTCLARGGDGARALQLVEEGTARCRDAAEALALGKVYERAGMRRSRDRLLPSTRRPTPSAHVDVVARGFLSARAAPAARPALRGRRGMLAAAARLKQGRRARSELLGAAAPVRRRSARHPSRAPRAGLRGRPGARRCTAARSDAASCRRGRRPKADATRHRWRGSRERSPEKTTATCSVAVS